MNKKERIKEAEDFYKAKILYCQIKDSKNLDEISGGKMNKTKLTVRRIIMNFNKIQINNSPPFIEGTKNIMIFLNKQGFYPALSTLRGYKKRLYKQTLSTYHNTYTIGGKTTYCRQFIEDCLKISLCLKIGLKDFEESTNNRTLIYNCK